MAEYARTSPPPILIRTQFYAQPNPTPSFAFSFHIFGAFPSHISRQFRAACSTLKRYLSCYIQMQFISAFSQSIALIVQILTNLLQLKYQQGTNDQSKFPFAAHPTTMILAISSSLVFFFAFFTLLLFPLCRSAVVARYCLVSSGCAMVATLASVLLPNSISPFVYAFSALLASIELLYWFYHRQVVEGADAGFQAYGRRFRQFNNNIFTAEEFLAYGRHFRQFFNNIFGAEEFPAHGRRFRQGNSSGNWPQRLPV